MIAGNAHCLDDASVQIDFCNGIAPGGCDPDAFAVENESGRRCVMGADAYSIENFTVEAQLGHGVFGAIAHPHIFAVECQSSRVCASLIVCNVLPVNAVLGDGLRSIQGYPDVLTIEGK